MYARVLRRFPVALLLLGLLGTMLVPAAAQNAAIEVYRSPEFGYFFWWDANEWTVQGQETESGSDWIQLANADTVLDIWGYAASGITARSCLEDRLAQIESSPGLVRFESLRNQGFAPEVNEWKPGFSASSEMILAFDTAAGRETFAASEQCDVILPGQQILLTSEWRLAEAFNDDNYRYYHADPGSTLTMPRSAWTFVPARDWPDGPGSSYPTQIVNADGDELGILTPHVWYDCDTFESTAIVAAEATSSSDFVTSPDEFALKSDQGRTLAPASARWIVPDAASAEAVALRSGDISLLELTFTEFGTLFYSGPSGQRFDLYSFGMCGGAGGAGPVLIDLDE